MVFEWRRGLGRGLRLIREEKGGEGMGVEKLHPHAAKVTSMAATSKQVWSGSFDTSIIIWDKNVSGRGKKQE